MALFPKLFGGQRPTAEINRATPTSSFLQGFLNDSSGFLAGWNPPILRETNDDYRDAWYDANAKATNAIRNSGWLTGGVLQAVSAICGPQLALNARPEPSIFGGTADAAAWARQVERRFEAWASSAFECDIYGRQNLGQMCAQAVTQWFGTGEIAGVVRWVQRPGNTHGTKIQVVPSTRIPFAASNPNAVQGLILDGDGFASRYVFEVPDPTMRTSTRQVEVQARDEVGRPVVIHIHDSPPTVLRGITPFAPVLKVTRQFDQLANATLTQSLIHAIFAATIESPQPTEQVFGALQGLEEQDEDALGDASGFSLLMRARQAWYSKSKLDLGTFGKIVHLFLGEKLTFHASQSPNANYKEFSRFLLREIARCLGITYEQLTGDREGATYSSERMGGAESWLITQYRRKHIAGRFMQVCYEAWLEEDIELGQTPFPGGLPAFIEQRAAASKCDWRGPPRPTADDLKTANANAVKLENKIITREVWCADEGLDWQDVLEQLKQEQDEAARLGVDLDPPAVAQAKAAAEQNSEDQALDTEAESDTVTDP